MKVSDSSKVRGVRVRGHLDESYLHSL